MILHFGIKRLNETMPGTESVMSSLIDLGQWDPAFYLILCYTVREVTSYLRFKLLLQVATAQVLNNLSIHSLTILHVVYISGLNTS